MAWLGSPLGRRLVLTLPVAVAAVGGAAFLTLLERMKHGTYDPHAVPSPLIGKPVPNFTLPAQPPATTGISSAELVTAKRWILVNFFASWCVPCQIEHPVLTELAAAGLPIWGIAYKDTVDAAKRFLTERGNPYTRLARDETGRVGIDFGVYGVPETFLIDPHGIIRWRWAGALSDDVVRDQLFPLLRGGSGA
jgi:cytochrome c biogenesis protein CcmG/thiol:disulfide interchange protein DsbE